MGGYRSRSLIMTDSFFCPWGLQSSERRSYIPRRAFIGCIFQGKVLKNICWDIRITGYLTFDFSAHLKSRNAHKSKETSYLFYIYLRIDYQLINPLSLKTNRRYFDYFLFVSLARLRTRDKCPRHNLYFHIVPCFRWVLYKRLIAEETHP